MILISFLAFFILFTAVGIASSFWRKDTIDDYFLASRGVSSWLVGLSYGATISSGATFIGFAGLAYHSGIVAVVTTAFLTIGDHVAWILAGGKIRQVTEERNAHTYSSLVGKLGGGDYKYVTAITAVLTIIFLGAYCAAQLVAGAKIGQALFDWNYNIFIFIGAGVLLAYCWAGGIRASIWTDVVQAVIILFSLLVLVVTGLEAVGGFSELMVKLEAIDSKLVDPFQWSMVAVVAGWFFFGIGVLGQPQLMVRHMVAASDEELLKARRIYLSWRWVVLMLSCMSGMIARVLLPEAGGFDPELSIPALWEDLLPPVLVGLLVAGLFSATMSTADSLLLSASSALTQHLVPAWRNSYKSARLGTVFVIALIVLIALFASKGVLALVILAWAGLGSAVAPLVVVQLLGGRPSQRLAVQMMISGFAVSVLWRYGLGWHAQLLELVPGMLVGFAVYVVGKTLEKRTKTLGFEA